MGEGGFAKKSKCPDIPKKKHIIYNIYMIETLMFIGVLGFGIALVISLILDILN